jgi:hypothetical protein
MLMLELELELELGWLFSRRPETRVRWKLGPPADFASLNDR